MSLLGATFALCIGAIFALLIVVSLSHQLGWTRDGHQASAIPDTSGFVGAEYTPWRASNQLWWIDYGMYRSDIERELTLARDVIGFKTLRMFLHNMLYDADPEGLKDNMTDFLNLCDKIGFNVGFVFFDDCWNNTGASLTEPCVPKKGVHNGCWKTSPQANQRGRDIQGFKPYVTDIVSSFSLDSRVVWWEIYNEPNRSDPWSMSLRHAAYGWAKSQNPPQPVISCWGDSEDTDLVDHHQYNLPWKMTDGVFANPSKGGLVTEAGARWYQKTDADSGSPLTVINWLSAMKRTRQTPFIPGVMINWEVMVGHSQTRWKWKTLEGTAEPPIPWHGHLFADGTPVSFTEAASIRRYVTGVDDFLFLQTFLDESNPEVTEEYLVLEPGDSWSESAGSIHEALVELTFWPTTPPRSSFAGGISSMKEMLSLSIGEIFHVTVNGSSLVLFGPNEKLETFDLLQGIPEGGLVMDSWNMLRVMVQQHRVRVWMNPQFSDVVGGSVPAKEHEPIPMPPRIDVPSNLQLSGDFKLRISAAGSNEGIMRVDYISVLPPKLYGLSAEATPSASAAEDELVGLTVL